MNELLYRYWCYPVLLMGGSHQINTSYVAAGAALVLIFCLAVFAASHKSKEKPIKSGGEIIVNRSDPTRDYLRWELMSWPEDWEDGDRLIFTVVEHRVVAHGPEVEVKKNV